MVAPYLPTAVANHFVEQFANQSGGIEHMKLQKLVYCAYGWWLAVNGLQGNRLTTEGPEIWRHGPVFSSMYRTFRIFGRQPIFEPQSANPMLPPVNVDEDDNYTRNFIHWVWGRYGHLSGFELSDLTHRPGSPWYRTAMDRNFQVAPNTRIPDEYIHEEFSRLLNADRAQAQNNVQNSAESAIHA